MQSRARRCLVLLAALTGCIGNADMYREDDVFVATLQADIRFLLADMSRSDAPTFCIAIDPGDAPQSPKKEFVVRVAGAAPRVVPSAVCEVRSDGVVELPNGKHAILLTVGPAEWVKPDEAEVEITVTSRRAVVVRRRYRLAHEAGRWVCLGQVMTISPA